MQEKIKFSQKKEALLAKTMPLKDIYKLYLSPCHAICQVDPS